LEFFLHEESPFIFTTFFSEVCHLEETAEQTDGQLVIIRIHTHVTSVAMQRRCKHAFLTIWRLCFQRDPWKVVIKKG
jgi:hypothetical protein